MTEDPSGISMKTPDITAPVYRAPELIQHQNFDHKVDIWAFGCVLFEMITQRQAFGDEWEIRNFMAYPRKIKVFESDYPEDIVVISKSIEGLINEMLQLKFNRRPSADSVLIKINGVLAFQ
jgi:serine/threonine protein kinase